MSIAPKPFDKTRLRYKFIAALLASCAPMTPGVLKATTVSATFQVQMTVTGSCSITSTQTLDFGTVQTLASNVDSTTNLAVQCGSGVPYAIGLDYGTGPGASPSNRLMGNGGQYVSYALYQDFYSTLWGNTLGSDTLSATGNGGTQNFSVYGRAPAQSTPTAGSYTDTITITVTY